MTVPTQTEFHSAMQALPLVSVDWVVVDVDGRVLTGWIGRVFGLGMTHVEWLPSSVFGGCHE